MKPGKGRRHKRTESQAVTELESVFKSVDLEGDGQLDYASFQTAMFSLGVMLDDEKMEELYKDVDPEDTGEINYDEFLKFLKAGKFETGAALDILESAKSAPSSLLPSAANTAPVGKIPAVEKPSAPAKPKKKMDPKKKSVIQRAVIVIKKAAMKNISREEVVEFLKDKGLQGEDINYAYEKAQEQAMSPEERVRYLKNQVASKDKELKETKAFARHLSDQAQEKNTRITKLQRLLDKAASHMLTLKDPQAGTAAPVEATTELKKYITTMTNNKRNLPASQADVLDQDLKKLGHAQTCLEGGRLLLAYLFLESTEALDMSSLPTITKLVEEFA